MNYTRHGSWAHFNVCFEAVCSLRWRTLVPFWSLLWPSRTPSVGLQIRTPSEFHRVLIKWDPSEIKALERTRNICKNANTYFFKVLWGPLLSFFMLSFFNIREQVTAPWRHVLSHLLLQFLCSPVPLEICHRGPDKTQARENFLSFLVPRGNLIFPRFPRCVTLYLPILGATD